MVFSKLTPVVCLGLVARASAYARAAFATSGQELAEMPLQDYVEGVKGRAGLGDLQLMASCCGEYSGNVAEVQNDINTNKIFGSTGDVAKQISATYGCSPVAVGSMGKSGDAGCSYVSVFQNMDHADHQYAANCVPATVCKEDVVGMTKGLIATYGVVLQILQQNLGSLAYIGEGTSTSCYEGMNKINQGQLHDVLVTEPVKLGPITIGHATKIDIEGVKKLGVKDTLSNCKDDSEVAYLFIHNNLYWSKDESNVNLQDFEKFKAKKAEEKEELKEKKEAEMIAAAVAAKDTETAEAALDKVGAAPQPAKVVKEEVPKNAKKTSAKPKEAKDRRLADVVV